MRYCEGQFLEVAQRHGLCRPSSSVLTLTDILELHASVVRASAMLLTSIADKHPIPMQLRGHVI